MCELDRQYPGYGFAQHKGYGTEDHREALKNIGRCTQHRELFLRKLLSNRVDPNQIDFLVE
jgi:ribonuclease HII